MTRDVSLASTSAAGAPASAPRPEARADVVLSKGDIETEGFAKGSALEAPKGALLVPVYFATDRQVVSAKNDFGAAPNRTRP